MASVKTVMPFLGAGTAERACRLDTDEVCVLFFRRPLGVVTIPIKSAERRVMTYSRMPKERSPKSDVPTVLMRKAELGTLEKQRR